MAANIIHTGNGKMRSPTDRATVKRMVKEAVDAPGKPGLVVHFHGGLVNYEAGCGIAERLDPEYRQAGVAPFFFVWESGLLETFRNNLATLAKEQLFKIIWKRVAAIAKRKALQTIGMKSQGGLPKVDVFEMEGAIDDAVAGDLKGIKEDRLQVVDGWTELSEVEEIALERELERDNELRDAITAVSNGLRTPEEIEQAKNAKGGTIVRASEETIMDPEAIERYIERPIPGAKGLINPIALIKGVIKIAYRVIRRFNHDRDHGLHATVVEEVLGELYVRNIGGAAWGLMKGDTRDAFNPDGNVFGGTAFLEELRDALRPGEQRRITLVGHSTGAIYIAELLEKADAVFRDRPEVTFEVIFLAPAATFKRCKDMLDGYGHRITSLAKPKLAFRMFTMSDKLEREDQLVKIIYPHSLLYFVSGVTEKDDYGDMPIVGMERFLDQNKFKSASFADIIRYRGLFRPESGWEHADHGAWSISTGLGRATSARSHGAFDDDPETIASVKHILQHGF